MNPVQSTVKKVSVSGRSEPQRKFPEQDLFIPWRNGQEQPLNKTTTKQFSQVWQSF